MIDTTADQHQLWMRLLTLANKQTPRWHHDWTDVIRIADVLFGEAPDAGSEEHNLVLGVKPSDRGDIS